MKQLCALLLLLCATANYTRAGDDASGPIKYSVDLGQPFTTYVMTERDKAWSHSLVKNLKYHGKAVHFVRTTLPLAVRESTVQGAVYQAVEKPSYFYVVPADVILEIGSDYPRDGGSGGFSVHAPKSRNFIVALNCCRAGVLVGQSTSPIIKGKITWNGRGYNRVENKVEN